MAQEIRVQLHKVDFGKIKARGNIVIHDKVRINISVIEGKSGPFVSYPSYKKQDGTWESYVAPVSRDVSDLINQAVAEDYQMLISGTGKYSHGEVTTNGGSDKDTAAVANVKPEKVDDIKPPF